VNPSQAAAIAAFIHPPQSQPAAMPAAPHFAAFRSSKPHRFSHPEVSEYLKSIIIY